MCCRKGGKREYPVPNMPTIMKATTTIGARPLKPGSSGSKEVRGKVEHLSKSNTSQAKEEKDLQREKGREPRGKEKVLEESQKKRKLVHITISSRKFGTSVSLVSKDLHQPPKLMDSTIKMVKVEMVRRAEVEEATKEAVRRVAEKEEEAVK